MSRCVASRRVVYCGVATRYTREERVRNKRFLQTHHLDLRSLSSHRIYEHYLFTQLRLILRIFILRNFFLTHSIYSRSINLWSFLLIYIL